MLLLISVCVQATDSRKVLISEIMAVNGSVLQDEDGDHSDWIEIHNPGSVPVDLSGWALTDNPGNPGKWKFPAVTLLSGGYLLVFASEKNRTNPDGQLHTNFKLSGSGEYLALMEPDLETVSFSFGTSFPVQQEDISYGLFNGMLVYFPEPTPRRENTPGEQILAPSFSHTRGFYDAPFFVEIASPVEGLPVYYTTDGTRPSMSTGILYTVPVEITTTTPLSAVILKSDRESSAVVTHTYLFIGEVLKQPDNPKGYPSEWSPLIYSAGNAPADYEMDPDVCNASVYKEQMHDALTSVPSLVLVTTPGFIFSHSTDADSGGIYIYTGDTGRKSLGREWERAVSAEYIDPLLNVTFQINCGLRLHGGNSRKPENSQKHSFRLSFRNEYGPSMLNYDLFGNDGATNSFNALVLRAGYNYSWIKNNETQRKRADYVRDPFAKNTQLAMGHLSAHNKFVHLYINGLYWGLYNISEKITNDFMESYMGGNEDDWDVVADQSGVVDGNRDAWNRLIVQVNSGFSSLAAYRKVQGLNADGSVNPQYENLLDIDNLIDYMIYNMYIGNVDWDHNNWIAARNRAETKYGFRFFCWDAETALLELNADMTGENNSGNPSMIYTRLRQNGEFRLRFADRLHNHFFNGGSLTPGETSRRYAALADEIDLAIIGESARWGDYRKDVMYSDGDRIVYTRNDLWYPEVQSQLTGYFPYRSDIVLHQFREAGLYPSVDAPVFSHYGGYIESAIDLTMTAKAGDIWFTIDDSDPRETGGAIALPIARLYTFPMIINGSGTIKARARLGDVWSALTEATFASSDPGIFVSSDLKLPESSPVKVYPNPFALSTNIEYRLSETGSAKVEIVSLDGRVVETLYNGIQTAGSQRITWIPKGLPGGVYFYRLSLDDQLLTGKIIRH